MKEKGKTRSELKHEAILDAAKRAFLAFGVQGTSMDKLAEMADVSKRTVWQTEGAVIKTVSRQASDKRFMGAATGRGASLRCPSRLIAAPDSGKETAREH